MIRKRTVPNRAASAGMKGVISTIAMAPAIAFAPLSVAETPLRSSRSENRGSDSPIPSPFAKMHAYTAPRLIIRSRRGKPPAFMTA